jgi:hypothetical protein
LRAFVDEGALGLEDFGRDSARKEGTPMRLVSRAQLHRRVRELEEESESLRERLAEIGDLAADADEGELCVFLI